MFHFIVKKIKQRDDVTWWLQFELRECQPTEILSKEHSRQREQEVPESGMNHNQKEGQCVWLEITKSRETGVK